MTYIRTLQTVLLAIAPILILLVLLWWSIAQKYRRKLPFHVKTPHAVLILILNAGCLLSLLGFGIYWPSQILFVLFVIGTVASVIENPSQSVSWLIFGYCLFTLCFSLI